MATNLQTTKKSIEQELILRTLAQKDLYSFVKLKWERYNNAPFMEGWHIQYLCKILESTLPCNDLTSGNHLRDCANFETTNTQNNTTSLSQGGTRGLKFASVGLLHCTRSRSPYPPLTPQTPDNALQGLRFTRFDLTQNHSMILQSENPTHKGEMAESRLSRGAEHWEQGGSSATANAELERDKRGSPLDCRKSGGFFGVKGSGEGINPFLRKEKENTSNDFNRKDNAKAKTSPSTLITRLMINMPPSYGKTEIIARSFIAWALGRDRKRKFFYISYSDELCKKIANQVRDLLKSKLWSDVFLSPPQFLQDNAQEFVLREGGGLFVTTLKSALTGFHAHQILIDDPIKVSEMSSRAARNLVNQNFKESVLSRLQDNKSNITILMQRLGSDDLCGFLLNEREFDKDIINQWKQVSLKAIEKKDMTYTQGDFSYFRKKGEALFPQRHTEAQLEHLRLQMGNDEFSSQYLQEPLITSGGYFDEQYFSYIWGYEIGKVNTYIFVDNALSLKSSADNRALCVVSVESYNENVRYIVQDVLFGVWSEENTIKHILELKSQYKTAKTYIESEGGGLILHRLLLSELAKFNQKAKEQGLEILSEDIFCYTPSRKISKVDKIKAMRPFYNTGLLVFNHNARGLEQFKKELFSFNPDKPFRKDDCIDACASALIHSDVKAPLSESEAMILPRHRHKARTWRI